MKHKTAKIISQILFMLSFTLLFTQCESDLNGMDQPDPANLAVTSRDPGAYGRGPGQGLTTAQLCACLTDNYASETPTSDETDDLLFMREEEKLARDVYRYLYGKWNLPVFNMISQSEQRHMDLVGCLITKYGLTDPVGGNADGVFLNTRLQGLYTSLTAEGDASLLAALTVGAKIEDLDLADLDEALTTTTHADVKAVFSELAKGSRNHLRAFVRNLGVRGETYTPEYLEAPAYKAIIAASHERGGSICGAACPNAGRPRNPQGACVGAGIGPRPGNGPGNTNGPRRRGN